MQVKVIIDQFNTNVVEYHVVKYVFVVIEMTIHSQAPSRSVGYVRFASRKGQIKGT